MIATSVESQYDALSCSSTLLLPPRKLPARYIAIPAIMMTTARTIMYSAHACPFIFIVLSNRIVIAVFKSFPRGYLDI
jgi:hypothetical protein